MLMLKTESRNLVLQTDSRGSLRAQSLLASGISSQVSGKIAQLAGVSQL
jgi:hypothetical protein